MQPGIDNFIHAAKNKALDQTDIEILTDGSLHLTMLDDFSHKVGVHFRHFPDLVLGQAAVLMGFNLVDNGHITVPLKFSQMPANEIAQLIRTAFTPVDFSPETVEHLLGLKAEEMDQNVVLIFKV